MKKNLHKIGAVAYVLWALAHLIGAWHIYTLAGPLEAGELKGRVLQDAISMGLSALVALFVAVRLNWRNDEVGYWLNLVLVSIVDLSFLLGLIVPGYFPWMAAIGGPSLWIIGMVTTTLAYRQGKQTGD